MFNVDYDASFAASDLRSAAFDIGFQSVAAMLLDEADWLPRWRQFVAYHAWSELCKLIRHRDIEEECLRGKRPRQPIFSLHYVGAICGDLIALGWLDQALRVCAASDPLIDLGWFFDGKCKGINVRTQHFVLNLLHSWKGQPLRELSCTTDEPIFNALLQDWRTPDPQVLKLPLLAALDRHTHQSRSDRAGKEYFDCNGLTEIYNPFEVLSVLRLRDVLGLPNPDLSEHPLMQTALSRQLLPVQPMYTDELLEGFLARARKEFPDL